jgi:hypothetical protein
VSTGWASFLAGQGVAWALVLSLTPSVASAQEVPPKIDFNKKSSFEGKQFEGKEFTAKSFSAKEFEAKQYSTKAARTKEFDAKASRLREQEYPGKDYTPTTAEQVGRWRKMYEDWREAQAKIYPTTNVATKTDAKLEKQAQKFEKPKLVGTPVVNPTPENINKPVGGSSSQSK